MKYEVTATRRRPRVFDELVGQEFVVATLKNSLASGRIAHAFLFAGPRGVGKTSAARILAKALNCPDGPGAEGCESWEGSEEIARGTALDVIEIDGASNTSVNDVRQIKDEVLFAPNSSRYKIYIIDEVHMLSTSAFNALLKTIEEPPPYIIFIFATTEIHKVPATIRSRCQQFNFRLIPLDRIRECLAATAEEMGISAEEDALGWIARQATGSLRDAYTLFDQVMAFSKDRITLEMIHDKLGLLGMERLNALFTSIVARDVTAVLDLVEDALLAGVSVERFTMDLADYLRTLLLIKNGIVRESVIGISVDRIPEDVRTGLSREQLETANEMVLQLYRDLRFSVNQRFDLELVLSRLAYLGDYLTPGTLVDRIEALQQELIHSAAHFTREGGGADTPDGPQTPDTPDVPQTQGGLHTPSGPTDPQTPDGPQTPPGPTGLSDEGNPHSDAGPGRDESSQAHDGASAGVNAGEGPEARSNDAGEARVEGPVDSSGTAPPHLEGISSEDVEAIVGRFRAQRIGVATLLSNVRSWILTGDSLTMEFGVEFEAHALEADREVVQQVAMEVLARETLRLVIRVGGEDGVSQEGASNPVDSHVEMVRRVFRGEVLKEGQS